MSSSEQYEVKQAWKIGDFAKLFNKHNNTVDNWFKELEKRGIHYVNRSESGKEKIYDEEDFKIAAYINERRAESWNIDAIIDSLPSIENLSLRGQTQQFPQKMDELINRFQSFQEELEAKVIEASRQAAIQEIRLQSQNQSKLLEADKTNQLLKRKEDILTQHKLRVKLRGEAELEWSKIPLLNRVFKNKEEYIRRYEETYFEDKLNEEFFNSSEREQINEYQEEQDKDTVTEESKEKDKSLLI